MVVIVAEIRETAGERRYFDRVIHHPADGPERTLTAFRRSDTHTAEHQMEDEHTHTHTHTKISQKLKD